MAIKLSTKTNVDAPSANDPYGLVNNNSGSGDGTPVDKDLLHDPLVFFEKIMDEAGVTHNGLHDDDYDGFQLYEAFRKLTRPYDVYVVELDQTSTGNPTENHKYEESGVLAGDITYTRTGVGIYTIDSASSVFTSGKTFIIHQGTPETGAGDGTVVIYRNSDSQLQMFSYDGGVLADDIIQKTNLEIRIYD